MKRTKAIDKLISNLEELISEFGEIQSATQDNFDNKSEKWQEGEKGEEMQTTISYLEDAVNELQSGLDNILNAFESD